MASPTRHIDGGLRRGGGYLLLGLVASCGMAASIADGDIRGFQWGDPVAQVVRLEKAVRSHSFTESIPKYSVSIGEDNAELSYFFKAGELDSASYSSFSSGNSPELLAAALIAQETVCDQWRQMLVSKYGPPDQALKELKAVNPLPGSYKSWKATEYFASSKPAPLGYGGLSFEWKTARTLISLNLSTTEPLLGNGVSVDCIILYMPSESVQSEIQKHQRQESMKDL